MFASEDRAVEVRPIWSGLHAVSKFSIQVTDDAQYSCQWRTEAGATEQLNCTVSVVTGNSLA